jgi:hypothetical protein
MQVMHRRSYVPRGRRPRLADFALSQRARAIGALGLWPGLADRWEALQALAGASRSEMARGRYPTHRELGRWLNGPEGRSLQAFVADGIYDGEWVSEVVLAGEPISILGGRVARPRQIVEVVGETLAAMEAESWAQRARREFRSALRLGELVVERAGLPPGTLADHSLGGHIALPDQPVLQRLRSAVAVDQTALRARGIDRADLRDLIQPLALRLAPAAAARSVAARPLSSTAGRLILIAPSQLTSATLDRLCADVELAGARSRFLEQMRSCTEARVETLLQRLGMHSEGAWRAGVRLFRFDSDKLALVAILCGAQPAGIRSAQSDLRRVVSEFRRVRNLDDQVAFALAVTVSAAGYVDYDLQDETDLLVLTLDELEVVSDAHREEPLLLWHLLSEPALAALARCSEIGALDVVGHADRLYRTSRIIVSPDPAFDAAEELLTRARNRSERRAAPDPEARDCYVTVVRSLDLGADNVFERVAGRRERIELFVSCHDQEGWVRASAGAARGEPAGAVAHLAARWLSLIWERAEFLGLRRPERWRLEVAWDEHQRDELCGETHIEPDGTPMTELTAGPALLAALSRLDNSGDREVARAALEGWLLACGAGPSAHAAASQAVDRMLPDSGGASLLVWPNKGERVMRERLSPAPAISDACVYRVRSEIADVVRRRYTPGKYEGDQAQEILNFAVRASATTIAAELAELAPGVLYALVACHERAVVDELHRGLAVPVRAALYGRQTAIYEYLDGASDEARRTLALRFLIEHAIARPPAGRGTVSDATLERLRMLADFFLDGGGLSDAVWRGLSSARLLLPEAGPLAISSTEELNKAQWAQLSSSNVDAPERHQAFIEQMFRPRQIEDDPRQPDQEDESREPLDDAWQRAYGFTHLDMARVCSQLIASAHDRPDGVMALPEETAIALAAQRSGVTPAVARRAIASLLLTPPSDYDPFAIGYRPWRLRRKWSLASRPIVRWDSEDGQQLLWSAETLSKAGLYRTRMEQDGRRIEDPAVDDVARRVRHVRDREFNDEVSEAARKIEGAVIRARVTKIGGRRLLVDRRDIGDIDVLVVLREEGYVLALETKNVLPSLNAYAIAHERDRLAGPGGTIELHSRRLAWLIENGEAISREFGGPPAGEWRVRGAIVVPRPLATAFLPGVAMPILAASEVVAWAREQVDDAGVSERRLGTG